MINQMLLLEQRLQARFEYKPILGSFLLSGPFDALWVVRVDRVTLFCTVNGAADLLPYHHCVRPSD